MQNKIAREGFKDKVAYESTHLDPEKKQANSTNQEILTVELGLLHARLSHHLLLSHPVLEKCLQAQLLPL